MDVLIIRALALLGLAILVALAARRLRLPYTVGLALAGAALAAFRVNAGLALTHDLIFDVVLPPLLFEAALNLHWSELRRDLVPVVALSTVGVALGAAVVAGGIAYWLGWPVESALVFGALIAATDPIAVIALLRESGVTGRLQAPDRGREPGQRRRGGGPVHPDPGLGGARPISRRRSASRLRAPLSSSQAEGSWSGSSSASPRSPSPEPRTIISSKPR